MKASVIIPTRNRADVLVRCLAALTRQTLPIDEFEVLVVDNGSIDSTCDVAKAYGQSLQLTYVTAPVPGLHVGRHAGLLRAKSDVLIFADDDIEALPTWVEAVVDSFKDTGVALSVTPSVNAGNIVTMQINQAVTDVGAIDGATGQRTFLQRQIGSKVAVRSGETLVVGGLIRDNSTTGRSGIPGLQDIPLVGNFFGSKTNNSDRTELLVVITPRVIRSDQQARDAGAEMRERMKVLFPAGKVSGGDGVTR